MVRRPCRSTSCPPSSSRSRGASLASRPTRTRSRRTNRWCQRGESRKVGKHPVDPETITYRPGKGLAVKSEDGDFALVTRLRLQTLGTVERESGEDSEFGVMLRRARLQFIGNVFGAHNKFKTEFAFSPRDLSMREIDGNTVLRESPLLTWYIELDHLRDLTLRFGQYKIPFSRQRVISSGNQQMVDRSIANGQFNLDRDIGFDIRSKDLFGLGLFRYYLGIYNGEGRSAFSNNNFDLMYLGRIEVLPLGTFKDYSEGDLERLAQPGISIGVAYAFVPNAGEVRVNRNGPFDDGGTADFHNITADLTFKYMGLSISGEFFYRDATPQPRRRRRRDGDADPRREGRQGLGLVRAGRVPRTAPADRGRGPLRADPDGRRQQPQRFERSRPRGQLLLRTPPVQAAGRRLQVVGGTRSRTEARAFACRHRWRFDAAERSHEMKTPIGIGIIAIVAMTFAIGCSRKDRSAGGSGKGTSGKRLVIQNKGSDTLVNVAQAWAEAYKTVDASAAIAVTGGGSGTGISALINGTVDLANSSRMIKAKEKELAQKNGVEPVEFVVGYDALAVYLHPDNPITELSIEQLKSIYAEGGAFERWSQLGVKVPGCSSDEIVRVSRQNNSGTYAYFKKAVIGKGGEYKLGSRDMHGSKDVVDLVEKTPCAIGYSGLAYKTDHVKLACISSEEGKPCVTPSVETAVDRTYPIARPLFMYSRGQPTGAVKKYLDWILSEKGQCIILKKGYAPVKASSCDA